MDGKFVNSKLLPILRTKRSLPMWMKGACKRVTLATKDHVLNNAANDEYKAPTRRKHQEFMIRHESLVPLFMTGLGCHRSVVPVEK